MEPDDPTLAAVRAILSEMRTRLDATFEQVGRLTERVDVLERIDALERERHDRR